MKGIQHQHDAKIPQPVYIKCRHWARPQRTGERVSGKLRSREKGSMKGGRSPCICVQVNFTMQILYQTHIKNAERTALLKKDLTFE